MFYIEFYIKIYIHCSLITAQWCIPVVMYLFANFWRLAQQCVCMCVWVHMCVCMFVCLYTYQKKKDETLKPGLIIIIQFCFLGNTLVLSILFYFDNWVEK